MYFRFPIIVIFVLACIVGLMAVQGHFGQKMPAVEASTEVPLIIEGAGGSTGVADKSAFETGAATIRANDLKAHLEFLSDDLLEGRDTASRGARLAAMYIATHFERIGLKAVGQDTSYYQPVLFSQKHILPQSELKVEYAGEVVPFEYEKDFLVTSTPDSSGEVIVADLVFSGFGITAPKYDYDDYANPSVNNKVALYLSGEPYGNDETFFEGDKTTRYSNGSAKRNAARVAGALAAVGVIRDEQLTHFSWAQMQNYLTGPTMTLKTGQGRSRTEAGFPAVILSPEAASQLFEAEAQTYAQLDSTASEGVLQPHVMNKKIQMTISFEDREVIDNNVVGFLEGSDPALKSEVIVFTAHYDHIGIGAAVAGDSLYNGAADNASGTSGLLELAEAFASLPTAPRRSLLFLAVTGEEKGLLGSQYYVDNPIFPLEKTVANFNLDMIGIGDTTAMVVYGMDRNSLGDDVREAAGQYGLEIWPDDMPEQRIYYRSDHYSFARKGVPAVFPSFGSKREFFPEFRKFYHRPSDDTALPWLNYGYMQKHVQVVFTAALKVANADTAPKWTPGDEFEKVQQEMLEK